jgi:hypothetical protein
MKPLASPTLLADGVARSPPTESARCRNTPGTSGYGGSIQERIHGDLWGSAAGAKDGGMTLAEINRMVRAVICAARKEGAAEVEIKVCNYAWRNRMSVEREA